ncbi:MAG: 2OG-Fe(II) oxygenase [Verrucomicrobia bacterium]|nr:2OG-Fe(II) oxygenase [Verrucomicrobiota bacterium]
MFSRIRSLSLISFLLLAICFKTAPLCCAAPPHPESQIIILENFISPEAARALIQFYDAEKRNLNNSSDNELALSSIYNSYIRNIISEISSRVLQVMRQNYPLMGKNYHVDHGGLYSRIVGNYCPYHADNISFDCPIHGRNQGQLRTTCNGQCPGARFVPNHTWWREYTALIYLNEGFEGGEIAFEDGPFNRIYKKVVPIRANMLVLAPNGSNFYHEVFPIRSGKRYSLHLWYTSDPNH